MKVLSGGEKTRLAMIKLRLEPVILLILDEPTNHLDMRTKDILKQAIRDFNGTVIVVSHDREFLDGLVEKVYEFGGGKVKECLGGIYEFLEKKKIASLSELEISKEKKPSVEKSASEATASSQKTAPAASGDKGIPRLSYAEQKEREKNLRRLRKKVEDAEAEISRLEGIVAEIETEMAAGEFSDDLCQRHAKAQKGLENAMSLWEIASMELEGFQ